MARASSAYISSNTGDSSFNFNASANGPYPSQRVLGRPLLLRRLKNRHRKLGIRLTSYADVRARPILRVDPLQSLGQGVCVRRFVRT